MSYAVSGDISDLPDAALHQMRQDDAQKLGFGTFGNVFRSQVPLPDAEAAAAAGAQVAAGEGEAAAAAPGGAQLAGGSVARKHMRPWLHCKDRMNVLVDKYLRRHGHVVAAVGGPGVLQVLGCGVLIVDHNVQGVDLYMEDMGPDSKDLSKTLWEATTGGDTPIFTPCNSGFLIKESVSGAMAAVFPHKSKVPQALQWLNPAMAARGVQLWFVATARGVGRLHDAGFIHRDLKPENQICGESSYVRAVITGEIKVTVDNAAEILANLEVRWAS
jgi:serine/threonine protein kinase